MSNINKKKFGSEQEKLMDEAKNNLPGVIELVEAYGDYEETLLLMQEYLELTQPQASLISSNEST